MLILYSFVFSGIEKNKKMSDNLNLGSMFELLDSEEEGEPMAVVARAAKEAAKSKEAAAKEAALNNAGRNSSNRYAAPRGHDNSTRGRGLVRGRGERGGRGPQDMLRGDRRCFEQQKEKTTSTLDEFRAKNQSRSYQFNVRKAGEGCDESQWQGFRQLSRADQKKEEKKEEKKNNPKNAQISVEDLFGSQSYRGRNNFRGTGRGGRGRGGSRWGSQAGLGGTWSQRQTAAPMSPMLDSMQDFPTLGD